MKKSPKKKPEDMSVQEILFTLLADKIGSVDPKSIFYAKPISIGKNSGKFSVLIGGKKASPAAVRGLQAEAMTLEKLDLWKLFTNTLAHEARLRMFEKAQSDRDMDYGKAVLHSISIFETIVKAIKNIDTDQVA